MKTIVEIKNELLMPAIIELLQANKIVKLKITGNSMYPFIRHGVDSIALKKINIQEIKKLDIVLIKKENGDYVLHRIILKNRDELYIVGDAQREIEGPISIERVIAIVSGIWRKEYYISTSNILYICLVNLWMLLRPIRTWIIEKKTAMRSYIGKRK